MIKKLRVFGVKLTENCSHLTRETNKDSFVRRKTSGEKSTEDIRCGDEIFATRCNGKDEHDGKLVSCGRRCFAGSRDVHEIAGCNATTFPFVLVTISELLIFKEHKRWENAFALG